MSFHEEEVLGKVYDARLMRRLLGYLRPHKVFVAGALLSLVGDAAFQLVPPYLVKVAIDWYIAPGDLAGLNGVAALYLTCLAASFALEYAQTYMMQMIGQRIMFDMRMQIYRHLQRLDLSFYDRNPVGRLMTRVTTDVDVINDLFTSGVVAAFGDLFMLVGIMITLTLMDWRLALFTFSVLPLILVLAQWFRINVRESYGKSAHGSRESTPFSTAHQRLAGAAVPARAIQLVRFDDINRKHRTRIKQIFTPSFCRRWNSAAIASALILVWRRLRLQGSLTGHARGLPALPGRFFRDQRHVEKFNTPGGDGPSGGSSASRSHGGD